ncbi:ATP-binding protein [Vibrio sp. 10N.261.46.E12]|uniref:hybrid sensor histidine kinase/response regulator n=1 Tax=unclassified Vibrio TaxID=2614977 RepID=UPI00097663DD|nr:MULTISPECIES: ATP-binding protein [unclassified Vibrio]OMO32537.1 hybrid sensor histidine kinase/response regulator [Vibrio sp. 10N.261.45.E1]PMJ26015.1 hybrid sensor histidine kinase/response regulator [Vibrio sp. 10N.286.45.B6]PML89672.1 hybrid sensor histidine kinase/response regulator [Vibrio sp. 10N.261.49.E11]PMM69761.1 hybrid sensor histidine kinase/response regulator [Vibrio sp. 10N.261.46.F12]PMM90742.1 hybrid sensor histidine kinase/response regulator [Vibrio sp. 10N.261.46.E8]
MIKETANKQTIKAIISRGSLAIVLFLCLYLYASYVLKNKEQDMIDLQLSLSQAYSVMLSVRRQEQQFISTRQPETHELLDRKRSQLIEKLAEIDGKIVRSDLNISFNYAKVIEHLDEYHTAFSLLALELVSMHGQGDQIGLIEKLKNAALTLERFVHKANNKRLEELFIDTQDLMYQFFTGFEQKTLDQIVDSLFKIQYEVEENTRTITALASFNNFKRHFWRLQRGLKSVGYSSDSGLKGELTSSIYHVEDELNLLFTETPKRIAENLIQVKWYRYISTATLGGVTLLVLFYVVWRASHLETQLIVSQEKERQANRAKSAFLANMSHEIRTPLNGVIGMSEILAETKLSPEQKDCLGTINTSSQALLMLINDILDLSKIESGKLEINPHTTDLRELLFDSATLISSKAYQKQIKLEVEVDDELPEYIHVDENKVRQVLMNFASNAIKFTEQGSIVFAAQRLASLEKEYVIEFSVRDTGIGIAKDQQEHIFKEFCQEYTNSPSNIVGTGLGLSISSRMVEIMGGSIDVESEKGVGSCFRFQLTVMQSEHSETKKRKQTVVYYSDAPSKLLLDDLFRFGYSPKLKSIEANLASGGIPDIAFTEDINQAKALHHQAPEVKIIMVKNNLSEPVKECDFVSGYVTLPMLGSRLSSMMNSLLERVPPPQSKPVEGSGRQKVLVVEDNRVNQKVVCINLDKLGIEYWIANDGQQAIDLYREHHQEIGLVLMDCMMPNVDGFEATEQIRRYEESLQLQATHILALTASVLDDDIKRCFECGMDDYLPKPFKRDMMLQKIDAQQFTHEAG